MVLFDPDALAGVKTPHAALELRQKVFLYFCGAWRAGLGEKRAHILFCTAPRSKNNTSPPRGGLGVHLLLRENVAGGRLLYQPVGILGQQEAVAHGLVRGGAHGCDVGFLIAIALFE